MSEKVWESIAEVRDSCTEFACVCGREVELWINGGELDRRSCPCGREYELRYPDPRIDVYRHTPPRLRWATTSPPSQFKVAGE